MPELALPRVLYKNLARSAAITSNGDAAGFPAKAAQSDNTYEFWKPSSISSWWRADLGTPQVVSGCGIAVHDIGTIGAHVQAQYSHNDVDWLDASDSWAQSDDSEILLIFPPIIARYWRLRTTNAAPTIANIAFGPVLTLEMGLSSPHSPIELSRKNDTVAARSEGGQWLGASVIRTWLMSQVVVTGLEWDWYRTYFHPFVKEARSGGRTFYFATHPTRFPQSVGYCWLEEDPQPSFRAPGVVDVSLTIAGASRL